MYLPGVHVLQEISHLPPAPGWTIKLWTTDQPCIMLTMKAEPGNKAVGVS